MDDMVRVAASQFFKEPGRYQDLALTQPVIVSKNGRDRTVMISIEEYERLKRRDRQVLAASEFTPQEIEAMRNAPIPAEAEAFNHEYKP
jgi:hypothetical protein